MITVDLKKKILVDLAPFTLEGYFSSADPSALSNYLNVAPERGVAGSVARRGEETEDGGE